MKQLFTSYFFGRLEGRPQVQICSYHPDSWNPTRRLYATELVWRNFRNRREFVGDWRADYREQLEGMLQDGSLQAVLNRIPEGAVLLCWEHDASQCHRQVLANFLNEHALAQVAELPPGERHAPRPKKQADTRQLLLF